MYLADAPNTTLGHILGTTSIGWCLLD